MAFLRW